MSNYSRCRQLPFVRVGPAILSVLTALGLAAVAGNPLHGQQEEIKSPYRWIERGARLGLVGGYYLANRGNLDHGVGSTPFAGLRFRYRVSSPLSLEAGIIYGPSQRWVIDPRLETGPAPVDTVDTHWILTTVGVQLGLTGARKWHGIHPYLTLGGGMQIGVKKDRSEYFTDPEETFLRYDLGVSPMIYGGLGAEVFPSSRFGIGVEVRDNIIRLKSPDGWFSGEVLQAIAESGGEAPKESQWTHNFEFTLNLWYYF